MNAPKVHHLQHVHLGHGQHGAQQPQVMVGRYGDYTYRVEQGKGQGGERSSRSGGSSRGQGPGRRLSAAPRRPPARRPVNVPVSNTGGEDMDDHMDDTNEPFDPFKQLAMQAHAQRQGGQGQGRDQRGSGSGGHPRGKIVPPLPRPEDPAGDWMKMQLPGAALLLGKAGPPASGMELLGAMASVVLGAVHKAVAGRQGLAVGQAMLAASLHAMRRPAVSLPTLNLLMVKNLLLSQQRGHFEGQTHGGDRPPWLGDRLALMPLHVLNIGRPRTDEMRKTANFRKEQLMLAQRSNEGKRS